MPKQTPETRLSPTTFDRELRPIREALALTESEDSWEKIANAIQKLVLLTHRGASDISQEFTAALRSLSQPLNSAAVSERTRLSGAAIDLIGAAASELGNPFEPLLPLFFPTLILLCTRTNKVFISRARTCIITIIEATQSPSILTYLSQSAKDKSVSLRLVAAEAALACLNSFNPPNLQKESRAREIEALIKCAGTDPNADVRKLGRKIYEAYTILLPHRVESFTAPLTPTIRKYLNIASRAPAHAQSNPPSRPASSQSTRSALATSSSSSTFAPSSSRGSSKAVTGNDPRRPLSTEPGSQKSRDAADLDAIMRPKPPPMRPRTVSTVDHARSQAIRILPSSASMPPPDLVPSRLHRAHTTDVATLPHARTLSTEAIENAALRMQRPKLGPQRPLTAQGLYQETTTASSSSRLDDSDNPLYKRSGGGARRVLRPADSGLGQEEHPKSDPGLSSKAKAPIRPESACDVPADLSTPKPSLGAPAARKANPVPRRAVTTSSSQEQGKDKADPRKLKAPIHTQVRQPQPPAPTSNKPSQSQSKSQRDDSSVTVVTRKRTVSTIVSSTTSTGTTRRNAEPAAAGGVTRPTASQLARIKAGPAASSQQRAADTSNSKAKAAPGRAIPIAKGNSGGKEESAKGSDPAPKNERRKALVVKRPETPLTETEDEDEGERNVVEEDAAAVPAEIPLPPSPIPDEQPETEPENEEPKTDDEVSTADISEDGQPSYPEDVSPTDSAEEPLSPPLALVIDPATPTPKASLGLAHYAVAVEQTPISALVDTIHRGFLFTPSQTSFDEDDEDEEGSPDRTFRMDADSQALRIAPLSWGRRKS